MSEVRIPSLAKFILNCIKKNKKKEAGNGPFLKKLTAKIYQIMWKFLVKIQLFLQISNLRMKKSYME